MTKRDKKKDMFYNAIDYLVMLVIIIGVILILGWKFEILFNKTSNTDTEEVVQNNTQSDVNPSETDTKTQNIDEINKIDEKNSEKLENADNTETNQNENTNNNENTETETSTETNQNENNKPTETTETKTEQTQATGEEIKINIPAGTLPGATGQILANAGLVESADAFVKKAVEMKLDRKLKSGDFTIKKGLSLEEIVKTIAQTK
ncbi:MAG: hypothetical protein MSH08_06390 [Ezakiella sp.]|nr:hypothetical protein [Ezakiella sp.]MDD7471955.1 hypothetical protein [Bacillota bacterium]MDY3923919.1 hypothetical protein [Ezakiella sp.]